MLFVGNDHAFVLLLFILVRHAWKDLVRYGWRLMSLYWLGGDKTPGMHGAKKIVCSVTHSLRLAAATDSIVYFGRKKLAQNYSFCFECRSINFLWVLGFHRASCLRKDLVFDKRQSVVDNGTGEVRDVEMKAGRGGGCWVSLLVLWLCAIKLSKTHSSHKRSSRAHQ